MIVFESMPISTGISSQPDDEVIIARSDTHLGKGKDTIALKVNKATSKTVIVTDGAGDIAIAKDGKIVLLEDDA